MVLTNKNKETQHYIHPKHKRQTEETCPNTNYGHETEWALFLQPQSPYRAYWQGTLWTGNCIRVSMLHAYCQLKARWRFVLRALLFPSWARSPLHHDRSCEPPKNTIHHSEYCTPNYIQYKCKNIVLTSNVTGRQRGRKRKLRAGYRALSLKRTFYTVSQKSSHLSTLCNFVKS